MTGLTIIPVRANSKGLKDKAMQELGSECLLERTIRQAMEGIGFPIVVWTDYSTYQLRDSSLTIFTGEADYMKRPKSRDDESTEEALQACLHVYKKDHFILPDVVCFMTVNTPVREMHWLQECKRRMETSWPGVDSVVIVGVSRKQHYKRYKSTLVEEQLSGFELITSGKYQSRQTQPPELYPEHSGVCLLTKTKFLLNGERLGPVREQVVVDHRHVDLDIHDQRDLDDANRWLEEGRFE